MRHVLREDPRSLVELRRLALRAQRKPGAREVLHDALLETWPRIYEDRISEAYQAAEMSGYEFLVVFNLTDLSPYESALGRTYSRGMIPTEKQIWFKRKRIPPSALLRVVSLDRKSEPTTPLTTNFLERLLRERAPGFDGTIVYRTRGYL